MKKFMPHKQIKLNFLLTIIAGFFYDCAMNTKTALQKAVDLAGGQASLARALSESIKRKPISQVNVWDWLHTNNPSRSPPADYCPDIEAITGITCEELRPDVSWHILRGKKKPKPIQGDE